MTGVRFADVQARPAEFLNLTSLTLEEFEVLVAPFEAAFQDHMAAWRLDAYFGESVPAFRVLPHFRCTRKGCGSTIAVLYVFPALPSCRHDHAAARTLCRSKS
jgi:hypothetical protein